ncbi:MAG: hypothetical protein IKO34_00280, partial [Bacteroidales bacterium]|nr:hypothetical protein [Bacteroidales bacterium]
MLFSGKAWADLSRSTCTYISPDNTVTDAVQTVSGSLPDGSTMHRYDFYLTAGRQYTFSLCECDGGYSGFDTYMGLYKNGYGNYESSFSSNTLTCDDYNNGCTNNAAKIVYAPTTSGWVSVYVSGYSSNYGSYTLAFWYTPFYTLTVNTNIAEGGSVNTSGGSYVQGATVSLTATANSGYTFAGWSLSGAGSSLSSTTSTSTTFTMGSENATVTAVFISSSGSISEQTTCASCSGWKFEATTATYSNISHTNRWPTTSGNSFGDTDAFGMDLPFNFTMCGTEYTTSQKLYVNSNGVVTFNSSQSYQSIADSYAQIHAFATDLNPAHTTSGAASQRTSSYDIFYEISGSSPNRILKIEYYGIGPYCSTSPYSESYNYRAYFQIWLYETTNVVELRYGNTTWPASPSYSGAQTVHIGIKGTTTANGIYINSWSNTMQRSGPVELTLNSTNKPASGTLYRFTPVADNQVSAVISGNTSICDGNSTTLSVPDKSGVAYLWSNGGSGSTAEIATAGTYSVVASYAACAASASVSVSASSRPTVTIGKSPNSTELTC